MELTLHKRHEKGGATYINPETRARVQVSRKMFVDGLAPDTIRVFEADNIAPPSEKDQKRAQRAADKAAKAVDLPKKAEKLREKLAKLEAAIQNSPAPVAQEATA